MVKNARIMRRSRPCNLIKRHAPESKSAPGRGSGDENQGAARRNGDEKLRRRSEEEKRETLLQLIIWGPN
ncbi:hypothetical protein SLEP1_g59998 [Rubroshorea leprosula]|uniref:Uncharacterized protein n=1 Tax=Rubroshorea leprosula TaxID=152421 RepID=A0AAV5MXN4_9ROSI|nr:hypothetical protein SLEP1_g59998 [Rubroshorea leprosula]